MAIPQGSKQTTAKGLFGFFNRVRGGAGGVRQVGGFDALPEPERRAWEHVAAITNTRSVYSMPMVERQLQNDQAAKWAGELAAAIDLLPASELQAAVLAKARDLATNMRHRANSEP